MEEDSRSHRQSENTLKGRQESFSSSFTSRNRLLMPTPAHTRSLITTMRLTTHLTRPSCKASVLTPYRTPPLSALPPLHRPLPPKPSLPFLPLHPLPPVNPASEVVASQAVPPPSAPRNGTRQVPRSGRPTRQRIITRPRSHWGAFSQPLQRHHQQEREREKQLTDSTRR
jgi:hypothetical protein